MAQTHGMTRDANGILWFNVNPGRGGIGRMDPKTERLDVFIPPAGMSPTGGATPLITTARARSGRRRRTARCASIRTPASSPSSSRSPTRRRTAPGVTYGAAADRDGNGWWAEMGARHHRQGQCRNRQGRGDQACAGPGRARPRHTRARKFFETYNQPDFNSPLPWAQGPRRMGTDKADDVLWVGNSWGANLARINTKTNATTYVPLPNGQQPYHVHVDKEHRPWTNLWGADRVMRYDPKSESWTAFDLPTRGAEPRYISLLERDGARPGGVAVLPGQEGRHHDAAHRGRTQGTQRSGRRQ